MVKIIFSAQLLQRILEPVRFLVYFVKPLVSKII